MQQQDDDNIESLLKIAGRRSEPDPEVSEAIKLATKKAWLDAVKSNRQKRQRQAFSAFGAVAAILLVAVVVFFPILNNDSSSSGNNAIASVIHSTGLVYINQHAPTSSNHLYSGDVVSTGEDGALSLAMPNNTTLTFGANTSLNIESNTKVYLSKGRIYFDSQSPQSHLIIDTEWGNIIDIGTQYELAVDGDSLKVAMRQGEVKMELNQATHTASVANGLGDVIIIDRAQKLTQSLIATSDAYWDWVRDASAQLNLEGKSVYEIVNWASRLTGKPVIYSSSEAELSALRTHLSGGLIDPKLIEDTLPLILNTTQLTANVNADSIEVSLTVAP